MGVADGAAVGGRVAVAAGAVVGVGAAAEVVALAVAGAAARVAVGATDGAVGDGVGSGALPPQASSSVIKVAAEK